MHGHSYRCELTFGGQLNENGIIVDFDDLAVFVNATLLPRFDHTYLNEVIDNPTAEHIAAAIFEEVDAVHHSLVSVRLWETRTSSAIVFRQ